MRASDYLRLEYKRLKISIPEQERMLKHFSKKHQIKNLERHIIMQKEKFDKLHLQFGGENAV